MHQSHHLLRLCRSVMPGVAGVVLATATGRVLAHEPVADAAGLARDAVAVAGAQRSALVPRADGLYLVVFVPQDELASSPAPALAVA